MQVLLVEDNESTRTLLDAVLASRDHVVTACADAESGLEAYSRERFPLVLVDWLLPGMDGIEFCRRLRAMPGGERCVILMVTARSQPEDLRSALAAGADDYLGKPIDVEALNIRLGVAERSVLNLTRRKQAEDELSRAFAAIEQSHADVMSILDKFRAGTVLTDPEGRVHFVNRAARSILGLGDVDVMRAHWETILPLSDADRDGVREVAMRPERDRDKWKASVDLPGGERRWLEIEVRDDPRDSRGKILFFYDESDLHSLRRLLEERASFHDMVGRSAVMQQLYAQIRRLAEVDATVLVEGETGTGKELVAHAIHEASHRRSKPFIAMNCAGLTESLLGSQLFGHKRGAFTGAVADHKGFFEAANGGTLFLDEIGDVPPSVQTSLLRVLQEREVTRLGESTPRKIDVRVIAATHHDLAKDVEAGSFRADLLYRVRVARVAVPTLRERREDIPLLAKAFLQQFGAQGSRRVEDVSREALRQLLAWDWPGNVRELRAAIEYAVIGCEGQVIQPGDLPPEIARGRPAGGATSPAESRPGEPMPPSSPPVRDEEESIRSMLLACRGNRKLAAQRLGMSRSTFYRRLADLGLVAGTNR